jgi:hypothetical protein
VARNSRAAAAPCSPACRANITPIGLVDQLWLKSTGIYYNAFKPFLATGVTGYDIVAWIGSIPRNVRAEIIALNNQQRDLRLSDLSTEIQEYMED